jgi:hypothetical protein
MDTGSISLYDEVIVNESSVEEDLVHIVWWDKCSLFEVGVIDSSISASTGGTHGGAIQLPPTSIAKGKDVVTHDDVQAGEDLFDWEVGW